MFARFVDVAWWIEQQNKENHGPCKTRRNRSTFGGGQKVCKTRYISLGNPLLRDFLDFQSFFHDWQFFTANCATLSRSKKTTSKSIELLSK